MTCISAQYRRNLQNTLRIIFKEKHSAQISLKWALNYESDFPTVRGLSKMILKFLMTTELYGNRWKSPKWLGWVWRQSWFVQLIIILPEHVSRPIDGVICPPGDHQGQGQSLGSPRHVEELEEPRYKYTKLYRNETQQGFSHKTPKV